MSQLINHLQNKITPRFSDVCMNTNYV